MVPEEAPQEAVAVCEALEVLEEELREVVVGSVQAAAEEHHEAEEARTSRPWEAEDEALLEAVEEVDGSKLDASTTAWTAFRKYPKDGKNGKGTRSWLKHL